MKNHNVSHVTGVISLSCTLRGFNVDPLYGRPKMCLTGFCSNNDSLICKLIQVCNWPSIETTGAFNSKSLFLWLLFSLNPCMPWSLLCSLRLGWERGNSYRREMKNKKKKASKKKDSKKKTENEMSTCAPLEINSGGSSGSHSYQPAHRALMRLGGEWPSGATVRYI